MVDVAQTIPHIFLDFMQMREFARDPLVFVGGEGIRLTDSAGRRYIDGLSGVFVASLGHGNLPVIEAMTAQARQLAFAAARERGLILRCGNEFATLAPPLVVTPGDIDEMCAILAESVAVAREALLGVTA